MIKAWTKSLLPLMLLVLTGAADRAGQSHFRQRRAARSTWFCALWWTAPRQGKDWGNLRAGADRS